MTLLSLQCLSPKAAHNTLRKVFEVWCLRILNEVQMVVEKMWKKKEKEESKLWLWLLNSFWLGFKKTLMAKLLLFIKCILLLLFCLFSQFSWKPNDGSNGSYIFFWKKFYLQTLECTIYTPNWCDWWLYYCITFFKY